MKIRGTDFVMFQLEVPDPDGNVVILHRRADGTFGSQNSD
jgi:hypothetical protein